MRTLTAALAALTLACVDAPTLPLAEGMTPEVAKLPPGNCCTTPAPPPPEEHEGDRRALEAFYAAVNDLDWNGWGIDSIPFSKWAGVTTGYDRTTGKIRVTRLVVDSTMSTPRSRQGIPRVLGDLTNLRVLDLRHAGWRNSERHSYGPTAVPRTLMQLEHLDSLRLGWVGNCIPSDSAFVRWIQERENIRRTSTGQLWVTGECIGPVDFRPGAVAYIQGIQVHPDSLMYGRDTWIAYAPVSDTVALNARRSSVLNDSTRVQFGSAWPRGYSWVLPWPVLTVEVCPAPGEACQRFPMSQGSDSVAWDMDPYTFQRGGRGPRGYGFVHKTTYRTDAQRGTRPIFDWNWDIGATRVPGELVRPGTTIAVESHSPIVGDSVLLDRIEVSPSMEPTVLNVVIVPISSDSTYFDALKADRSLARERLFAQMETWFPVRVEFRWHGETLLHSPACGSSSQCRAESDLRNVSRLRSESGESDSYWLGLSSSSWGFIFGMAYQPGQTSIASFDGSIIAHEIGHNMGLAHPNEACDPGNSGEECSDHRDKIKTIAIGEWFPTDTTVNGWWNVGILGDRTYLPTLRDPFAVTFMHSVKGIRTRYWESRLYESIAPWQWQVIHQRLTGGSAAADRQRIVVVN